MCRTLQPLCMALPAAHSHQCFIHLSKALTQSRWSPPTMTDPIAEVVDRYDKLRWVKCHVNETKKENYFCLHNKSLLFCYFYKFFVFVFCIQRLACFIMHVLLCLVVCSPEPLTTFWCSTSEEVRVNLVDSSLVPLQFSAFVL